MTYYCDMMKLFFSDFLVLMPRLSSISNKIIGKTADFSYLYVRLYPIQCHKVVGPDSVS